MQLFILNMDLCLKIWTLLACRLFTHKSSNRQNVDVATTTVNGTCTRLTLVGCRVAGLHTNGGRSDVKNQTAALPKLRRPHF